MPRDDPTSDGFGNRSYLESPNACRMCVYLQPEHMDMKAVGKDLESDGDKKLTTSTTLTVRKHALE